MMHVLVRLAVRSVWLMMALLFLSSCATTPSEQSTDMPLEQREALLMAMDTFEFNGGLGIWTDEQSLSARIRWTQAPDALMVRLTGPLGVGDLSLSADAQSARLTRGQTLISRGASADLVLQQGLGLSAPVPIEQLQQWVRGLPGNATSTVRDEAGKLASLRYRDTTGTRWQARFLRYSNDANVALPSLITATGGPYNVRLLLKNWQVGTGSIVPEVQQSNNRLPIPSR